MIGIGWWCMSLTVNVIGGHGRAEVVQLLHESVEDEQLVGSDYYTIHNPVYGVDITPDPGYVVDHCMASAVIQTINYDSSGSPSHGTVEIPPFDTGTGSSERICSWRISDWAQGYWGGGGVSGKIGDYDLVKSSGGLDFFLLYNDYAVRNEYDTKPYHTATIDGVIDVHLKFVGIPGIIYDPLQGNGIVYDLSTGRPMCYT